MATLTQIWRHPVKAHGTEALARVPLTAAQCLPFDRHWAVAHKVSEADGSEWESCTNFSRGAKAPGLMAITADLDEARGLLTLTHPDLPPLTFNPDTNGALLVEWSAPLIPDNRPASDRVISVPGRGMTDSDFPSVSICNHASNRAVSGQLGLPRNHPLDLRRWRGNLWLEGLAPWEEFDLVGKRLRIGSAVLSVREQITRCKATTVNPETGRVDAQTLDALSDGWGMREFGVYATVEESGNISVNDKVEVL